MLEEMVASVMKKTLAQDFPHLKLPAAVFATIDSAAKSDAFDIEELIVHNEVTGEVFKAHITSYWYEYKLTVIDRFGNPDANYPALPGIKSKKQFKAGAVVAVALPYGDLTPAIIGEVELYQNIVLEALTQPGDVFYDAEFGWGLYDFIQSEDTELTRLEITQRVRLKLQKREVILPESIEISIAFEDDAVVLHCSFRFAEEDERRELDVIIGAVSVEVVSE